MTAEPQPDAAAPVRLILVDDHEMVIEGLKAMLAAFSDRVRVVGQAVGAERAREVWQKRFSAPASDAAGRAKQMRFLAARGFSGEVIRRVMMGAAEPALTLSVPLEVEVGTGKSWGEAH